MNNNLPKVHKNGFLNKIKSFLLNLFTKKEKSKDIDTIDFDSNKSDANINALEKYSYATEINKLNKEKDAKKSIIDIIEEKPELLNTISLDNLRNLTKLYDEIIEENNKKINSLKLKISN